MSRRGGESLWARHDDAWRDPVQIATGAGGGGVDPLLLRRRASGDFWGAVERARATLLVSREYEHLLTAVTVAAGKPLVTHLPVPHPSGIAFDPGRKLVHVASTRNPNRVIEFAPASRSLRRADSAAPDLAAKPLLPQTLRLYPGALYMHDLALVGGELHANAVGENAVVRLPPGGGVERVWWPRSIERRGRPDFGRNLLQLNSIAAADTLDASFFTASAAEPGRSLPGQKRFPVDGRGVVFSGATREPVATGLTRPHSARLGGGRLWVLDSGHGGLCLVWDGAVETVAVLPGWTRGLAIKGAVAFVATSRVIPGFASYAPGLDLKRSVCGVHAVDLRSGETIGSLLWPNGNQIFAVESIPRSVSLGFPLPAGARASESIKRLFYSYEPGRGA